MLASGWGFHFYVLSFVTFWSCGPAQELNGRLQPGVILGPTGQREFKSMEDLKKIRDKVRRVAHPASPSSLPLDPPPSSRLHLLPQAPRRCASHVAETKQECQRCLLSLSCSLSLAFSLKHTLARMHTHTNAGEKTQG